MSRQYFSETIAWATASGTAVANSTTETILFPNLTVPANYQQDGRLLRLTAYGAWGNVVTAAPTLQFRLRWGGVAGTVMAATGAINTSTTAQGGGASMTALWELEAIIQIRSNGSAGTAMTNGRATLFTATAPTVATVTNLGTVAPLVSGATGGSTPVVSTLDLTADTGLSLTIAWSAANAANSIRGDNYLLESLN